MNVFAKMIKLCKSVVGGSSTFTAFSRTVLKYTPLQKQFAVFVYNDKINISFSAEFKYFFEEISNFQITAKHNFENLLFMRQMVFRENYLFIIILFHISRLEKCSAWTTLIVK